jgi:glutamate/tyrosine decarboxylase-like PLP-dependent enzyme
MQPLAKRLNFIDFDEYPATAAIHQRVVNMMADILHTPRTDGKGSEETPAAGTVAVGSSEAIMLALPAHKWTWEQKCEAAGLSADRPNLILGSHVHCCREKFALYFDVAPRVLVKEDVSRNMAEMLTTDMEDAARHLEVIVPNAATRERKRSSGSVREAKTPRIAPLPIRTIFPKGLS